MWLNEAAHLWRLAAQAGPATLIEIGRERGGSTLLLAAATHPGASIYSYDPQTKHSEAGQEFDAQLSAALVRYDLGRRVHLIQEDSHVSPVPDGEFALVLVDGDPSLAGTRIDYERFCTRIRPGGHALFHDAAPGGVRSETLAPLMAEIENGSLFERQQDVGTFVHFRRSG
jgi:predicted O-methyltransferase YrrM